MRKARTIRLVLHICNQILTKQIYIGIATFHSTRTISNYRQNFFIATKYLFCGKDIN